MSSPDLGPDDPDDPTAASADDLLDHVRRALDGPDAEDATTKQVPVVDREATTTQLPSLGREPATKRGSDAGDAPTLRGSDAFREPATKRGTSVSDLDEPKFDPKAKAALADPAAETTQQLEPDTTMRMVDPPKPSDTEVLGADVTSSEAKTPLPGFHPSEQPTERDGAATIAPEGGGVWQPPTRLPSSQAVRDGRVDQRRAGNEGRRSGRTSRRAKAAPAASTNGAKQGLFGLGRLELLTVALAFLMVILLLVFLITR